MGMAAVDAAPLSAFPSTPDLCDPTGDLHAWYTRPAGALVRLVRPTRIALQHVQWMTEVGYRELLATFPNREGLLLVLDVSLMNERSPEARALLVKRAPELARSLRSTYVIPPRGMGRLLTMSVHAAAALLRTVAFHVEVRTTLAEVCTEIGLQHASTIAPSR